MAITDEDLNKIGSLIKKEVTDSEKRLETRLEAKIEESISDSEKRVEAKIESSRQRTVIDLGDFMEVTLFPMIAEKADKTDIDRLERKLDRAIGTNLDHETRITAIEHVPVVANMLRIKKSKSR